MAKRDKKNDPKIDEKNSDESKTKKVSSRGVKASEAIAKRASQMLAKPDRQLTLGDLEKFLLKQFPASDAESWDRTGMLVGEASLPVKKVAIALDPTISAIKDAARVGADVLVCHHPLFLDPPTNFHPESSAAISSGAGVWAAIKERVAVMSFHTALDVSRQAQLILPNMLGFSYKKPLCTLDGSKSKGFGQISKVGAVDGKAATLAQIASKCITVFGRAPRVWGDMTKDISCAVTLGGSASSFTKEIIEAKADVVICGEMKYHAALEFKEASVAVIELGHDISEFPLLAILAKSVADAGINQNDITILDQSENWCYPESIRL